MSNARELAELIGNAGGTSEQVLSGRRNLIINGGFDVWQRSTDASATGGYYAPDRWQTTYSTNAVPLRLYRQNSSSPLMDSTYHLGISSSGVATNTGSNQRLRTKFEKSWGLNSDGSARPVTISFWMRSPQNNALQVYAESSSEMLVAQGNTNWQKFTHTFTGSAMGRVDFYLPNGEVIDVELSQVQLELGSVATPFEHRSYGEELALCQRYYQEFSYRASGTYDSAFDKDHFFIQYLAPMRATPTVRVFDYTKDGHVSGDLTNVTGSMTTNGAFHVWWAGGASHKRSYGYSAGGGFGVEVFDEPC